MLCTPYTTMYVCLYVCSTTMYYYHVSLEIKKKKRKTIRQRYLESAEPWDLPEYHGRLHIASHPDSWGTGGEIKTCLVHPN